jgi:hypothetical protein
MRQAMLVTLLTTGLALSAAPVLSASEEAATRTTGIPGTDLAVVLPAEWRIWPEEESGHPTEMWATDVATRQICRFSLMEGVTSAEQAAHETVQVMDAHPQQEVVERTFLNVPAGNAVRVAYRVKGMPDDARLVLDEYYISVPDGVLSVHCSGDDPPSDRWLHVVEAIAPTPAGPAASGPFDPRVEVPERGFAVDFPAEWLVRSWGGPGPVLGGSVALRAVTLADEDGSGGYECVIEDDTALSGPSGVASLDEWRGTLISIAGAQERRASDPVVTEVSLPSGLAVRADWEQWSGMPATAWIFTDGGRRAALLCRSVEPPDDGWLSIAATFEFLPAED